jgi:hypothetical protein
MNDCRRAAHFGIQRPGEKFLPPNVDFRRSLDANADLSARHPDYGHDDFAVDDQPFVFFAR